MHVIFEGSNEKLMQHISIILSIFDSEDFEKSRYMCQKSNAVMIPLPDGMGHNSIL